MLLPLLVSMAASARGDAPLMPMARKAGLYPWHLHIAAELCWVGQPQPPGAKPAGFTFPWTNDPIGAFGGKDDPDPASRLADRAAGRFRPKGFVPRTNAFYVALPANDLTADGRHKPEAAVRIPWFGEAGEPKPGVSVCRGRWLQLFDGRVSCYAQWEGCGPGSADGWDELFVRPGVPAAKPLHRIGVSPAVRDFLNLAPPAKLHWRFVDERVVPFGPWRPKPQPAGIV